MWWRTFRKKGTGVLVFSLLLMMHAIALPAQEKRLTIIHTNDLHSHFIPFSPEIDFTPQKTGDDLTIGGFARIATVIAREKAARKNPVLVMDAGDFTMGSLFHMRAREESFELRLMKTMGYDVVTLGNHEFDLMPGGLARILNSARRLGGAPDIVSSNMQFSRESDEDDALEKAVRQGLVKPYIIKKVEGLRIGIFGLLGTNAAEVAPFASPVKFRDMYDTAREMVRQLREKEKADLVICISHSGLFQGAASEDEVLAEKVKGIDIIISGHTHTNLKKPLQKNGAIIVQAYEYGKLVGVLDVIVQGGSPKVSGYRQIAVDDSIPSDPRIQREIETFIAGINKNVLAPHNLRYFQNIAETGFDMVMREDETTLGNMITDSIRWYVNKHDYDPADPVTKVVMAVESNGVIRDNLLKGKTGKIAVADVFRTIPLGIGMDGTMAYPLITFYIYGAEIKKALEILTSIYPLKGSDYFLQISGIKFTYNPYRAIFDRVTEIRIGDEKEGYRPLDYSSSNKTLYRVAANIYNATFLKVVGNFTYKILTIVPKDRHGRPVKDLKSCRVDADRNKTGIQELKEWTGVMEYLKSFKDTNGNGLADIPAGYSRLQGRIVRKASLSPFSLLVRPSMPTWVVLGVILLLLLVITGAVRLVMKRRRRKN